MLATVLAAAYIAWFASPISFTVLGFVLGSLAYRILERHFHVEMHRNSRSPFFTLHRIHHANPLPENGCPEYWTFLFYFFVTTTVYLLNEAYTTPILCGIWFGITNSLFWYEWIHFLCHCPYAPLTRYGASIRNNHLAHHYENSSAYYEMLYPK